MRARPLPSIGSTLYLPASTYQVPIISISRSRLLGARLWVSAGVLGDVVELPALRIELDSCLGRDRLAEAGFPASVNDGPGQGQTARQPSW